MKYKMMFGILSLSILTACSTVPSNSTEHTVVEVVEDTTNLSEEFLSKLKTGESNNYSLNNFFSKIDSKYQRLLGLTVVPTEDIKLISSKEEEGISVINNTETEQWSLILDGDKIQDITYIFKEDVNDIINEDNVYTYMQGEIIYPFTRNDETWYSVSLSSLKDADINYVKIEEFLSTKPEMEDPTIVTFPNGDAYVYSKDFKTLVYGKVINDDVSLYTWQLPQGLDSVIFDYETDLINYIQSFKAIPESIGLLPIEKNFSLSNSLSDFVNADMNSLERITKDPLGSPLFNVTYQYMSDGEVHELNMEFIISKNTIQKIQITVR